MKRTDTKPCGSFTAWGTGFNYEYNAHLKKLDVFHAGNGRPLLLVDCDRFLARDPSHFVSMLDKSCQLRALTLTNNGSINLSETLDEQKLKPVMAETARLARHGFDLMQENFDRFERYFCQDAALSDIKIRRLRKFSSGSALYGARLETRHSRAITVESDTLHNVMSNLSQGIIQDLIPREFISHFDSLAYLLLKISSNISILSLILNEKFSPEQKLGRSSQEPLINSQEKT